MTASENAHFNPVWIVQVRIQMAKNNLVCSGDSEKDTRLDTEPRNASAGLMHPGLSTAFLCELRSIPEDQPELRRRDCSILSPSPKLSPESSHRNAMLDHVQNLSGRSEAAHENVHSLR